MNTSNEVRILLGTSEYQKQANPQELGFYGLIYISTNLMNSKIYIGQTTTFKDGYIGSGLIFSSAVKKYGRKNFVSHHLQYAKDKEELDQLERMYITSFNSTNPKVGYNIDLGGKGVGKMSEETKVKVSQATKGKNNPNFGRKHSKETRQKISKALTGKNHPQYGIPKSSLCRQKMSASQKGRKHSKETRQKISKARNGKYIGKDHPNFGKKGAETGWYKDRSHITNKVLFNYIQTCSNWAKEVPKKWGISDKTLGAIFKERFNTTSAKGVQKILADKLGKQVLNHENFIQYCQDHKDNFLQKSKEAFGISGEQLQRWSAKGYSKAKEQTIKGWCNRAKELEQGRKIKDHKRAMKELNVLT